MTTLEIVLISIIIGANLILTVGYFLQRYTKLEWLFQVGIIILFPITFLIAMITELFEKRRKNG